MCDCPSDWQGRFGRLVAWLVVLGSSSAASLAQCSTQWLPGEGLAGTNGAVSVSTLWDPDGPGPASPQLVVAGFFSVVGNTIANNIAAYDPTSGQWSALGAGITGTVVSLTASSNGDLVAGGVFSVAGGVPVSNIARWNGTAWSSLGAGTNGSVAALTSLQNGEIVAGGTFTIAGGVPASGLARWDGTSWSPLGTGLGGGAVGALTTMSNGDVVAGGYFTNIGGVSASNIARWNGTNWAPLGTGLQVGVNQGVKALTTLPNGDLVAGGTIYGAGAGAVGNIARWDGISWSPLGVGFNSTVNALAYLPNGDVLAGGQFFLTGSGATIDRVARWNGAAWSSLGVPGGIVYSLTTMPSGGVVAGGDFAVAGVGGTVATHLASWNGTTWAPLSAGTVESGVAASVALSNGDIVVAGALGVRRWNGSAWSTITSTGALALAVLPNGDIVAAGGFSTVNGVPANNIARWDGASWSPLGAGTNGLIRTLMTTATGDIIAGGEFTAAGGTPANFIARWNGNSWGPLGSGVSLPPVIWPNPTLPATVRALARLPNGDIIAGGDFTIAGSVSANRVARWDGTSWSPLGPGILGASVYALATLPDGDIIAGGVFTIAGLVSANHVARWDGTAWSSLGTAPWNLFATVRAVAALPNSDIVVGGSFSVAGGVPARSIARWDGAAWLPLGNGLSGSAHCLTSAANGDLVVGGSFVTAGSSVAVDFARLTTTCPATTVSLGGGCPSSGGANALTATLPWAGSTWQATGTGLPASSIVLLVHGFSPIAVPLASILPQGAAGCVLLASPDLVQVLLSSNGTAQGQLVLPNGGSLAGIVLYNQMVPLELDPLLSILSVTSTNALAVTVGFF